MNRPRISVVIPVFRSGSMLVPLYERLAPVLSSLTSDWEVILVDDASNDGTFLAMVGLHDRDGRVKLIRFARNMGQHHATLCGIKHATGAFVITMDDDLQNPPEEIPAFISRLNEGYDMVIGRISADKKHSLWRNFCSGLMQKLVGLILSKPRDLALSSYRAMTRRGAETLSSYGGVQTYLPALILGSIPHDRIANINVTHHERGHGSSNYTLRKLIKLASYLIINYSNVPLRFMSALGFLTSAVSAVFAVMVIANSITHGASVKGWASLAVLTTLVGGSILMCLGIIGEYIGRLLTESSTPKQFPIFEIRD